MIHGPDLSKSGFFVRSPTHFELSPHFCILCHILNVYLTYQIKTNNMNPQNTTAASPLHDKIEEDIKYMSLNETEAQEYRDLVWEFINVNRWTFLASTMAAMNQVVINSTKPTN